MNYKYPLYPKNYYEDIPVNNKIICINHKMIHLPFNYDEKNYNSIKISGSEVNS